MILLSIGHDVKDPGATHDGRSEFELATLVAKYIHDPEIEVVSRPLMSTVRYANSKSFDLVAELHFNAGAETTGCETLYCPGSTKGEKAAQAYHSQHMLFRGYPKVGVTSKDRGVKEGWHLMEPNTTPNYFLSATRAPALILEAEFMSTASKWKAHNYCRVATCIVAGLLAAQEKCK